MSALNNFLDNLEAPSNLSLLLTLVWVIEEIFAPSSGPTVLIGQYATSKAARLEHNSIIEEVLKRTSSLGNIKFLLESKSANYIGSEYQCLSDGEDVPRRKKVKAIWFIDSLESFDILANDLINERYHYTRSGFYCIVYTGSQDNLTNKMRIIFRSLFNTYVLNVNLLVRTGRTTRVYTYQPFTKPKCHDLEPHFLGLIDATTGYKFREPVFFLKKLRNMWGCRLRITTWHEPPFIVLEGTKIKGIEGLLLEALAELKNFTIQLKKIPIAEQEAFPNQTDKGFIKMLIDRETNITIVGLVYDKNRLQVAEAAYTYMRIPIVLAIPMGRHMTQWERIFHPFNNMIWSCLSSSIVIGIIVILSLKRFFKAYVHRFVFGSGIRTPFTNLWNVLYGGAIHGALPKRNFARYLLAIWLFYTWVLRSAYIGELFILLKDSNVRSYLKTVSEVVQNDFTIYSYQVLAPALHDISIPADSMRFIDSEEHSLKKCIELLRNENSKTVVTILGPVVRAYNKQKENQGRQINVLPESLFMSSLTFYMPKHSYLKLEFDEMLLKFMSAGLMEKYSNFYLGENTLRAKTVQDKQDKLSLRLLFGVFSIYLALLLSCCLIFLCELSTIRFRLMRKIIDFFNY